MLPDFLREQIQQYFRECVSARSLVLRKGQRVMIAEVAKNFAESVSGDLGSQQRQNAISVIEAGTGTGKTLAYTLGALPVAMAFEKPLVISTATVALQEQLIEKDLPELKQHSSLEFEYALVKGRARYVCLSKLLLWEKRETENQSLFIEDILLEDAPSASAEDIKLYREMIDAWDDGEWDGERDHWPVELKASVWSSIMANRQDCTGKKCPHYNQCSFFDARKKISEADVIVTNHDLVMADLFQDEGNILPPVEDTFYVFDEAHHLPDKVLSHYASNFRIKSSQTWLLRSQSLLDKLQDEAFFELLPQGDLLRSLDAIINLQEQMDQLYSIVEQCFQSGHEGKDEASSRFQDDRLYYRFEFGEVPEILSEQAAYLRSDFLHLQRHIQALLENLKHAYEDEPEEVLMAYITALANIQERSKQSTLLFEHFSGSDKSSQKQHASRIAKWLSLNEFNESSDFQLSASPIHASEVLNTLIWDRAQAVLLTSATLTALGKFDYFIERTGLPEQTKYFRIESPFDYASRAKLVLPDFKFEPSDTSNFCFEVSAFIEKWQPLSMGTLVLFSSWAQMNEVSELIAKRFHSSILKQGDLSKDEIIRLHKEKINQNQHSMIFGLASFAEGIDLPGDYLSHVIICKIPFSVPTDPMAEAQAEWVSQQGRNPFRDISIPEASLRLIQACGRLLRSENDSGRISILDKRLNSKFYGKQLLDALPPYQRQLGDDP